MNLDLNALLADLENSAGIEKTASASIGLTPAIKSELAGVLEKKAEQDMTKVAMDEGAALAKQLLEKLANEIQDGNAVMEAQDGTKEVATQGGTLTDLLQDTVNQGVARGATSDDLVDEALDKQAQENKVMAQSIMKKIAQIVGEPTTTPAAAINVAGAAVPNMVQMGNAGMTAWDDSKVTPMPGQEGTINNILEALVAKAQAEGGGSDDLVNGTGAVEGAVALGSAEDQVEKAAAVNALVNEGVDFDTAVTLVKEAEDMIYQEEMEYEKQAAFEALVNEGMDFDDAVELVKAAEYELYKEAGIKEMFESAKKGTRKAYDYAKDKGKKAVDHVKNHKAAYGAGAAGLAAAGGGAYAYKRHQEKKAAMEALMQEGVDFDTAVGLVKQAEYEVYGEANDFEKIAAVNELMESGYDFDTAVELVKEAEESSRPGVVNTTVRAAGRGVLEGTGGAIAGSALGLGAGILLARKTKLGQSFVDKIRTSTAKNPNATHLNAMSPDQARTGILGAAGLLAGGAAGGATGLTHGAYRSVQNSRNS